MQPFTYYKAPAIPDAIKSINSHSDSKFIGGGTNLLDLMKQYVETPAMLVDVNGLDLKKIEKLSNGNLMVGALVSNSTLAYDQTVVNGYPLLSKAILAGASAQLRNMATTAGNIMQRTRCYYFYDTKKPCNKREPGSGCSAINGFNRIHAVLGTSDACIATHPSDMCVALSAHDAIVHVEGSSGKRTISFSDFHKMPGSTPEIENALNKGELITHLEIPQLKGNFKSDYIKIRDRSSYEFALASAAVAQEVNAGTISNIRIALGGVGTKPWRAYEAEKFLTGKTANAENYRMAADLALMDAKPRTYNKYKIELSKRSIIQALQKTGG